MTEETARHDVQALLDMARNLSLGAPPRNFVGMLADALETEASDRVHAEEALRRYGSPVHVAPAPEFYEDTLEVKANLDTIGIISLKLPIRLADESGAPDIERAFHLAQDIVDAALELAAGDEAHHSEHLADVIPMSLRAQLKGR